MEVSQIIAWNYMFFHAFKLYNYKWTNIFTNNSEITDQLRILEWVLKLSSSSKDSFAFNLTFFNKQLRILDFHYIYCFIFVQQL